MIEVKFKTDGKDLYINGNKVMRGWETWDDWYKKMFFGDYYDAMCSYVRRKEENEK